MYYIDLGSSTIKAYRYENKKLEMIEEKSILFKNYYDEKIGIQKDCYMDLIEYFRKLSFQYVMNNQNTKIIATGIWRKIPEKQKELLKDEFESINLNLNIISHEEEGFLFGKAMQGIYNRKKILMVNMGGKTTELILIEKGNIKNKNNINIGVADILNKFPTINDVENCPKIEEVMKYGLKLLEKDEIYYEPDCAIFTGGELRFQKLLKYKLIPNTIFQDNIHEYMVSYKDLEEKNKEILSYITIEELYRLMPNNPGWMDGAKAGALLRTDYFSKNRIKYNYTIRLKYHKWDNKIGRIMKYHVKKMTEI